MVDWRVKREWLWDYLPAHDDDVDFFVTEGVKDRFSGYGKFLSRYPRYLASATKALPILRHYDAVVAWTGKNGIPIALLRTLTGVRGAKLVILNMSVRGPIVAVKPLIRLAMSSVDVVTFISEVEMLHANRSLRMPDSRIKVLHPGYVSMTWLEPYLDDDGTASGGAYIFSSGRSYRDYGTLFSAIDAVDAQLIVNARSYNVQGFDVPPNVRINDLLPQHEFYALLTGAEFVVLPLQGVPHGAGESHLVHVMAAGKAAVVTAIPAVTSFVDVEQFGLLVEPGDIQGMRRAIQYLLDHPAEARRLGARGQDIFREQYSMEIFARKVHQLVHELA
jgi:glycosyltransferase involved in cell wall biosynthesis